MSERASNSLSERWLEAVRRARMACRALEDAYEEVREAFERMDAIRDDVQSARGDVPPRLAGLKFPLEAGYHHLRDLRAVIGKAEEIDLPEEA
jgi:hypothetical protein